MKRQALTEREVEILQSLAAGLTASEIAARLYVTLDTTKTHLRRIYRKLNVPNAVSAVVAGHELGYIELKCPEKVIPPLENRRPMAVDLEPLPARGYESPPIVRKTSVWKLPTRKGGKFVPR